MSTVIYGVCVLLCPKRIGIWRVWKCFKSLWRFERYTIVSIFLPYWLHHCFLAEDTERNLLIKPLGKIWACVSQPLSLSFQEDPRLKYPVHMRTKASLDPGDLGPLPVSIIGALEPYYPQIHVLSADKYPCLICDLVLMHKYEWNIHITQ